MSVGAVNKQTGERIPTAGMPAIDSVLSGTSTNPVQNRVVKAALDDKQDAYDTITYAEWQAMTPEQKAAKDYYISDYPSSVITAGNVSYDNTTSGMAANKVQGAIDELKSGLTPQQLSAVLNSEAVEDGGTITVYKTGRIVHVSMEYTPKSGAIANYAIIASQLPIPATMWLLFDGVTQLAINIDGAIQFWFPTDTTTLTRRDFTFSYVSAS